MKKSKKTLIAAVAIAGGCILVGGFLAEPLVAQIRAAFVKDLNNPAYQPFGAQTSVVNFPSNTVAANAILMTVPAGKRAVIEHFSCIDFLPATNNFVRLELRYTLGGQEFNHQFVHTKAGESFFTGVDILTFSQPLRAYADPSTTISVHALRRSFSGSGGIECKISGHYVDTTP